ncbi:MAG: flagella basal body P-ring formation protein FlgA [Deltaproteobacteria bacterium]|nr:MAG: flagella basal body P-ring formation protein FlgA [Deltaproteobacteria bacterium]
MDQVALEPPTQVQVVFVEDEIKEEKKEVPIVEAAKSDLAPVILSPKKGDTVTLLVSSQDFKIRALGRVKEVQDNGNHILVENLDSKKELWGRALNASEVEIVF